MTDDMQNWKTFNIPLNIISYDIVYIISYYILCSQRDFKLIQKIVGFSAFLPEGVKTFALNKTTF